jgi:hypothetical protein
VSFRLSSGTLDSMAGVFAPPKKYRMGTGGGKGRAPKAAPSALAAAVFAQAFRPSSDSGTGRVGSQVKHAFGGSNATTASRRAVATLERTARGVPEVMVRRTGKQTGGGHVLANFTYISRLGHGDEKQVDLYTSDGDVLRDGKDMQILAQDWQEWEMGGDARRKGATSMSFILSMPAGTDPEKLKDAALDFARDEFANRSWVAALHVDRDHPHMHITIARRDHDGRRFHPNRDDLFRYRQRFAEKLRDRGIEANATPARARGIDPKHEPIAARKMREKGRLPRVDKSRIERADQLRKEGRSDPVREIIVRQQAAVRDVYARSIAELSASVSGEDRAIAESLKRFVAAMPVPEANSARALRGDQAVLEKPVPSRDPAEAHKLDPVGAALARSRAMREMIDAKKDDPVLAGGDSSDEKGAGVAERLQQLLDMEKQTPGGDTRPLIDETLRRVQERDREQKERDRGRDKGGPER